ncbi:nuclear transport factor 2 family protein [Pendulispora brunnea]|uniref:Nuclear transport factor 2 family protein n=1 Tax=Pendulispora brunnea TaxID=2905690 RepID=A0ABZ2KGV7_9BACT
MKTTSTMNAAAIGLVLTLAGCSVASRAPAHEAQAQSTRALVQELFDAYAQGDSRPFFDHVADDVHWTIAGTNMLSGEYHSKKAFLDATYGRLSRVLKGPVRPTVQRIVVEGNDAVVQWRGASTSVQGQPYDNEYVWVLHLEGARIVEVTAYFDGGRLDALFRATERRPGE